MWDVSAPIVCSVFACIVCWKTISTGVIYAADDIWWHILWLQDFIREVNEGIIYPRWLAHSNYLYGSPTFVFYPPFCFYVGLLVQKIFALGIFQTTTALFTIGTFASGLSTYLAAQRLTGKAAALGGAIMVMTAPFVTLDIYFRASLAELFSLIWLPIILLNVDQVLTRAGKNLLALGFCMLTLTHIPCLMIYTLVWLTRLGYCATSTTNGAALVKPNLLYALLGIGCASFYLLPVLMEHGLVNIAAILDRQPWEVNLLFSPNYRGFFPIADIAIKSFGTAILLYAASFSAVRSKKTRSSTLNESTYWLALNFLTFFLMSDASRWLWHNISIIQYLQFPWRLMTVNLFSTAMLFAVCLRELPSAMLKKYLKVLLGTLLVFLVVQYLSADFFITKYRSGLDKPEAYLVMDSAALKVAEFARYEMPKLLGSPDGYPGVPEYTPVARTPGVSNSDPNTVGSLPHAMRGKQLLTFVDGAGTVSVTTLKSYLHEFSTDTPEHITFKMRTYYYPAWHLYMDGKAVELKTADDGEMLITAPRGKHQFQLKYESTPAFQWGIALSLLSAIVLLWLNRKRVGREEKQKETTACT